MPEPQQAGGSGEQQNQEQAPGLVFDTWITEQPAEVRSLLDGHTAGLKSALESERTARKNFEKQIKDLSLKAEKGSDLERQLAEIAKAQEQARNQTEFYEQAHTQGVKNLKLAFLVATQEELIDNRGKVDFDEMKKRYPELFGAGQARTAGNAGAGTNTSADTKFSMDDFIRKKVNR
jgi:hypothetical protein